MQGLLDFLWRLVLSIFDFIKDFFYWVFDTVLSFFVTLLEGMGDLFAGLDVLSYVSAIPPEMQWMLNAIGFSQGLGMVTVAITIRMLLNLIPFVRI